MSNYTDLVNSITMVYPGFKIVEKSSSLFMKIINILLLIISFGQNKLFMIDYITTIGKIIYVPIDWNTLIDIHKIEILRHESIHLEQADRDGRILFSLKYLFWYFPAFFANGRVSYEMEAYTETIKSIIELEGINAVNNDNFKNWLIDQFTGPYYLWMSINKTYITLWVETTIANCIANNSKS